MLSSSKFKTGRNELCSCGSRKKFKKCCLPKLEAKTPRVVLGRKH